MSDAPQKQMKPADPAPGAVSATVEVFPAPPGRVEAVLQVSVNGSVKLSDTFNPLKLTSRDKVLATAIEKFPCLTRQREGIESRMLEVASNQVRRDEVRAPQANTPRLFPSVVPAEDSVDGAHLLDEVSATVRRFVVVPDGAADTVALWVMHTYALAAFDFSPRLTVSSPMKRCGKTTLLDAVRGASRRPISTVSMTTASLFRVIDKFTPTLIVDEADNLIAGRDADEEMRGILCSGYRRGEFVIRTVGDDHEPTPFAVFSAVAFGVIRRLPDTLQDRSITVSMRRKAAGELTERVRPSELVALFRGFAPRLARWTADHFEDLRVARPEFPPALGDRERDCWEPLLAIADAIGGTWPNRARSAAVELSASEAEEDEASLMILEDIKAAFQRNRETRIRTSDLLEYLHTLDDRPWPTWWRGKPLTARNIVKLLAPFRIQPHLLRFKNDVVARGYEQADFADAWSRYTEPSDAPSSVTADTACSGKDLQPTKSVTGQNPVTDTNGHNPLLHNTVTPATPDSPLRGGVPCGRGLDEENFAL